MILLTGDLSRAGCDSLYERRQLLVRAARANALWRPIVLQVPDLDNQLDLAAWFAAPPSDSPPGEDRLPEWEDHNAPGEPPDQPPQWWAWFEGAAIGFCLAVFLYSLARRCGWF